MEKKKWIKSNECMVKGCTNKKHEGNFVGDMCVPCYEMITEGKMNPSKNFIYTMYQELENVKKRLRQIKKYTHIN